MEYCDLYTHDQIAIFCISCYFWLQSQVHGEPYKDSQSSFKEQMIKCSKVSWNFSVKHRYRTENTNQEIQSAYSWHRGPHIWAISSWASYCVIFNVKSLAFKWDRWHKNTNKFIWNVQWTGQCRARWREWVSIHPELHTSHLNTRPQAMYNLFLQANTS